MYCPEIEIFPTTITEFQDSAGRIILDISEQTSVALKKELLVTEDSITVSQTRKLALSIPNTPKNYFYLHHLFHSNADIVSTKITARITTGTSQYLYDKLSGIRKNNTELEILFELESDWIKLLKETKLKDIELPIFEFSQTDVESKWTDDGIFTDGDDGYFFPLVNYGAWIAKSKRVLWVEDLRPFLSPIDVLDRMFAHIDWCVESPFYETNFGRRLWMYLLKSDYNNNEEIKDLRKFFATKEWAAGYSQELGLIEDWTENFDNGNNFDPVTGIIDTTFGGSLTITFNTDDQVPGALDAFRLRILLKSPINNSVLHDSQFGMTANDEFEYVIPDIQALPGMTIEVQLATTGSGTGFNALANNLTITLKNDVTHAFHIKGDIIDMAKEVNQEMTCWQVFQGLQHLIFGIADEDNVNRKVILYSPFDAEVFGETISGYFEEVLVPLKDYQPINTVISEIQIQANRFIQLGFAKSTDTLFKNKRKPDGNEYFVKYIDLGSDAIEETEDNRNPLFEGTDIKLEDFIRSPEEGVYLPYMIDNEDNQISYSIEPRIIFCKGVGVIGQDSNNSLIWEGVIQIAPEAFHLPFCFDSPYNTLLPPFETIIFNDAEIDEKLIYGDEENDLWSMLISRFFMQLKNRIRYDGLIEITDTDFFNFNLKNVYEIEYDGHPISGRLLAINDHQPCSDISTQIIFLPERTVGDLCITSTPTNQCENRPYIIVTINGDCFTFGLGGTFVCNVETFAWEYRSSETGDLWVSLGSGNTAELCDHPVTFIVRVTNTYDCEECPDTVATKTIDPCSNTLACKLTKFIDESGNICVQWEYTGQAPGNFTFVVVINGGAYTDEPLDDPYLICGLEEETTYTFTVTFTFDNGCQDLILDCSINTEDVECDNNPTLICVPVDVNGLTCYEFVIGGTSSSPVETFIVSWECTEGTSGTWLPGDDPVCCTGNIFATAIVFYCGCEQVCTASTECTGTGCTVVSAGTALMFAMCN